MRRKKRAEQRKKLEDEKLKHFVEFSKRFQRYEQMYFDDDEDVMDNDKTSEYFVWAEIVNSEEDIIYLNK